jgi:hypothetical protein
VLDHQASREHAQFRDGHHRPSASADMGGWVDCLTCKVESCRSTSRSQYEGSQPAIWCSVPWRRDPQVEGVDAAAHTVRRDRSTTDPFRAPPPNQPHACVDVNGLDGLR